MGPETSVEQVYPRRVCYGLRAEGREGAGGHEKDISRCYRRFRSQREHACIEVMTKMLCLMAHEVSGSLLLCRGV